MSFTLMVRSLKSMLSDIWLLILTFFEFLTTFVVCSVLNMLVLDM